MSRSANSGRASAQIASHKLYAPQEYLGAVRRDAILSRIVADDDSHVVLLQGPAGHGKTTLMQQIKSDAEQRDEITGWLTMDDADNDFRRLVMHLDALLTNLERGSSESDAINAATPAGRAPRSDWFISRLIRLDRPVSLFFDEFQTLSDKPVLAFFRNLFEHIPAQLRIFIGSRTVPDVGLARLVVNQQALILRAEELRFSQAEVGRFFAGARELAIDKTEVQAIYDRTEGWPAALQLYRLSLARPEVRRSLSESASQPSQLAEYLADNVLALQSPKLREFLLRTSLLSRLSAPLCNAVTGRDDSQALLRELEQSGLFLRSLDADARWFRYHTLFSSFLSEQLLEESSDAIAEVHRRAARWYHDHGIHDEALHHAIAIRDFGFAAEVLDTWSTQLVMDGLLATVERWSDRLPLDEIERHSDLVVKMIWALAFLRRRDKLAPFLRKLEQLTREPQSCQLVNPAIVLAMVMIIQDDTLGALEVIRNVEVNQPDAQGFRAFELGAAGNLKGYLALTAGDFESAREHLQQARAHGDRAYSSMSWGYSISTSGINLLIQGQLTESLERYRFAVAEPRLALDGSVSSSVLVSCYILALYESNQLDAAKSLFSQYHDVIAESAMHDYLAVSYIAMARIHDAEGQPAKAAEVLDEAELIGHSSLWPRLVRIVAWERVRRALTRGENDRAYSIASRISRSGQTTPEGWIRFSEDAGGEAIGEIRLAIHDGRAAEAIRRIADELDIAERCGRIRRQIKLRILDALAQQRKGSAHLSLRSLHKALQLAEPGGFIRSFIDEGPEVMKLLRESQASFAAAPGAGKDLLERILAAGGAETGASAAGSGFQPLEALTDREKEILMLLVNGASNKLLAKRMFVSENTVKFHLKNIYSKLGVGNRLQAISAARQMGLIYT